MYKQTRVKKIGKILWLWLNLFNIVFKKWEILINFLKLKRIQSLKIQYLLREGIW